MPSAWTVRRARVEVERWNGENPHRPIPWEWVEEALLAWRYWKELALTEPEKAIDHLLRYEEFARKLPQALCEELWPR